MTQTTYEVMNVEGGRPVKMWTRGFPSRTWRARS